MEKYLVTIDQDDPTEIEVEMDDPAYDGPETSMDDDEGVYHITAENEEEAIKTAQFLDSIGNPNYGGEFDGSYI
jgi:hypothetical protein